MVCTEAAPTIHPRTIQYTTSVWSSKTTPRKESRQPRTHSTLLSSPRTTHSPHTQPRQKSTALATRNGSAPPQWRLGWGRGSKRRGKDTVSKGRRKGEEKQ